MPVTRSVLSALTLLAGAFFGPAATPAAAQPSGDGAPMYLGVSPDDGSLAIRIGDLFDPDGELAAALHSGLPLRIRLVGELWKDGFFDDQRGRDEWRASVVYAPLERRYRVNTGGPGAPEISVDSLAQVESVLEDEFTLGARPRDAGRFYYLARVEVETLQLSDLEELQRWLRGELGSSERESADEGNAVGRGVRRALIGMLGLPARRFRVRSPTFEFEPVRE